MGQPRVMACDWFQFQTGSSQRLVGLVGPWWSCCSPPHVLVVVLMVMMQAWRKAEAI